MKPSLTLFGIVASVVYTAFIVLLRWSDLPQLASIPLNELGDFLAGVFGPLMLFWLILGFVQQQRELRQNTKALELQAQELKNSVDQHRQLVEATREQVDAELKSLEINQIKAVKESQPNFAIVYAGRRSASGTLSRFEITFQNNGLPASELITTLEPTVDKFQGGRQLTFLDQGGQHKVKWEARSPFPELLTLRLKCMDRDSRRFEQIIFLELHDGNKYRTIGTKVEGKQESPH